MGWDWNTLLLPLLRTCPDLLVSCWFGSLCSRSNLWCCPSPYSQRYAAKEIAFLFVRVYISLEFWVAVGWTVLSKCLLGEEFFNSPGSLWLPILKKDAWQHASRSQLRPHTLVTSEKVHLVNHWSGLKCEYFVPYIVWLKMFERHLNLIILNKWHWTFSVAAVGCKFL